jgi:REase_MTES_1575
MTTLRETAAQQGPAAAAMPRAERVAAATSRWIDELAALGGRDSLIHFRDLKVGTLDLAAAEPDTRHKLLAGEPVTVSRLFPHEPLRTSALRSGRAIRDKARELGEDRGLSVARLAIGIATWANPFAAHRPTVPVILRRAAIVARDPAETDFVIEITGQPELNPALLHALDSQLGLRFETDDLRDPAGRLRYPVVVERLREFAPAHVVDGFSIAHRAVLGTFAAEPLLLSRDLAALGADLDGHDVIAALAGDENAALTVRSESPGSGIRPQHLVLEADSAQADVVGAIAAGRHLRVDAPPGTGRTQTVTNAVAELVARGQRVLVVASKRSTLTDLVTRLDSAGLGDAVLDLAAPAAEDAAVRTVIEAAERLAPPAGTDGGDAGADPMGVAEPAQPGRSSEPGGRPAATQGDPLAAYLDALHRRRDPWGCSAHEVMAAVAAAAPEMRARSRISGEHLDRLGIGTREALRAKLRTYAELGGLSRAEKTTPWSGATVLSGEAAIQLNRAVNDLRTTDLPELRNAATRAAVEVGLVGPRTPEQAFDVVALLTAVAATLEQFHPELWSAPLDDYLAATADRRWRAERHIRLGLVARRRLRLQVHDLQVRPSGRRTRAELHAALADADDQLAVWREWARDSRPPRTGPHLPGAVEAVATVAAKLATITEANPSIGELTEMPFPEVTQRLMELADDRQVLLALPKLAELRAELEAAGLGDLLAELTHREAGPDEAEAAFAHAWQVSLLARWRADEPVLGAFDRTSHEQRLTDYRGADMSMLESAATDVLAGRARRFAEVAGEYEGQASVVFEFARSDTVPRTLRELVAAAPDVALAAVPCWVMPPLAVARTLPPRRLFDVVIVEDAGQVTPAEAVPALARATRVVLVGSIEQIVLPAYTTAVEQAAEQDESPSTYETFGDHEAERPVSVYETLGDVLPSLPLTTSYRVRDERLVGFAARELYRGRFGMLPGVGGPAKLRHELVSADDQPDGVDSSEAEVRRVVDLVLEHARVRPHESLGVVTLSRPHAARVETALRAALIRSPDVAPFLREDRDEPFFVKDIDRVAGEVRDAIIFTLGYGRSVDGRVLYRFGALDRPGGDRRLAAVIMCARERTTVVSSFSADDLSPRRLITDGGRALRDFLADAESPATPPAGGDGDLLAQTVANRLRAAGASVVVGYGSGSGRIEIAVRHPLRRDRFVLAVETDGPGYARAADIRERDRIRFEQLVRLGWSVHRVWSAAWAADPDGENARLVDAYAKAVADADAYDWARAAAEADIVAGSPDESDQPAQPADRPAGLPAKAGSGKGKAKGRGGKAAKSKKSDPSADSAETEPVERGAAPRLPRHRTIDAYSLRELAALARWAESDGVSRPESAVAAELIQQLALSHTGPRVDDVLRHAIRVARAGAPDL